MNKLGYENITTKEGLLFVTYNSLIAGVSKQRRKSKRMNSNRFDQILNWCGPDFDGCLLLDECHRAKNYIVGKRGTKTGTAVVELQKALPKARVVYCSATGITDPINMGYMSRLGLWGSGTPFSTFAEFLAIVESAVGMMELAVSLTIKFSLFISIHLDRYLLIY